MTAVEALAEAWASIDGKLEKFRAEKGKSITYHFDDPSFTGSYEGYMEEAKEMIRRLDARGFKVVAK